MNARFSARYDLSQGGYGALHNHGIHSIDLARFLVGDIVEVAAITCVVIRERPLPGHPGQMRQVTTDDAFEAAVRFSGGAVGTLEASRVATGCMNQNTFEVNGARGSIVFDLERLNELQVCLHSMKVGGVTGFARLLVGDLAGWEDTFVHEVAHFMRAVARGETVEPYGATFEDGYRALAVADAVLESAESGRRVQVQD